MIHSVYDPTAGLGPARAAHRVRLRQGRVYAAGSARDERMITDIAEALLASGKAPLVQRDARCKRRRAALPERGAARVRAEAQKHVQREMPAEASSGIVDNLGVVMELRSHFQQVEREKHAPASFDVDTQAALQRIVHGGVVDSLPTFVKLGRGGQRSEPVSTERARLADWLLSEEGKEWKRQRESLWDLGHGETSR